MLVGAVGCGQLFNLLSDVARATSSGDRVFNLIDLLPKSHQRIDMDIQDRSESNNTRRSDYDDFGPIDAFGKPDLDIEAVPLMNMNEKIVIDKTQPPQPDGASISMTNVSFAYPSRPSTQVLHDINLNIVPGQLAAFVGPSGSGKSTIFGLLERFYRPTSGSIHINSSNITKSSSTTFRQ